MYETLDISKVAETIDRLSRRIDERFPESGLFRISIRLQVLAGEIGKRVSFIQRPQFALRIAVALIITLVLLTLAVGLAQAQVKPGKFTLTELVGVMDASLNATVMIGAALFFFMTVETKIKRKRALDGLHQLRSLAHVIDMHQLTKDPTLVTGQQRTASSPVREMTPFELHRYLDYCSELLALTAKLAAIYGQSMQDREVLASVSEIENLTTDLSRKIWQKISKLT